MRIERLILPLLFAVTPARGMEGEFCRFNTYFPTYSVDSPECRTMEALSGHFDRLSVVAGFGPGELTLNRLVPYDSDVNASYRHRGKDISLTQGMLRCAARWVEVGIYVLGHEIGHAVQDREGFPDEKKKLQDGAKTPAERMSWSVRYESQADHIRNELLVRAGYDFPPADVEGKKQSCYTDTQHAILLDEGGVNTHPSRGVRYLNALAFQEKLLHSLKGAARARPEEVFDGAVASSLNGVVLPPGRYRPSAEIDLKAFDGQGRLRQASSPSVPAVLTAHNELVRLDENISWIPPWQDLVLLSPDEIVVSAVRGRISATGGFRSVLLDSLVFIIKHKAWTLLPGVVIESPSPGPLPNL